MSLDQTDKPPTTTMRARFVLAAWLGTAALLVPLGPARTAPGQALVTLNLTRFAKVAHLDAGEYAGVSPGRVVVHLGEEVVFVNSDTRHHTATSLPDATEFPQNPEWTDGALRASGKIGEPIWSTGDIAPGARSAPLVATKAGTYLYGCFYDYSAGMRGEIVVQP
jgi:plastocyanin